jgi:hypothetical protein
MGEIVSRNRTSLLFQMRGKRRRLSVGSAKHRVIHHTAYRLVRYASVIVLVLTGCGGDDNTTPTHPADTGVLRVHETNPRWLTDDSGEARYFTGPTVQGFERPNACWAAFQDIWNTGTLAEPNDYATAFDLVVKNGHNFVRLWNWELTAFGEPAWFTTNTYWRIPPDQMPYKLVSTRLDTSSGVDIAVGVYDLTQFNQTYFDRIRTRVISAVSKGLTPSVMLFEGLLGYPRGVGSFSHAMFGGNNVNGISAEKNGDGLLREVHTLDYPEITAYQDAYIKKMVDTLNDIDGYIYEIANEAHVESVPWKNHVAQVVRDYEFLEGRQSHPIWMSAVGFLSEQPPSNDYLYNNPHVDIVAPSSVEASHVFETHPPANQANKTVNVWFHDTDHVGSKGRAVTESWPWKSFTRGISPLYVDCPFDFCRREPDSIRPLIRTAMAQTLAYAKKINLKAMTVESGTSIIDSGYGLYETCAEYLMYMPAGGTNSINLGPCTPENTFVVEYFEPTSGITSSGGTVAGGAARSFDPPGNNPMVIHLKSHPEITLGRVSDQMLRAVFKSGRVGPFTGDAAER